VRPDAKDPLIRSRLTVNVQRPPAYDARVLLTFDKDFGELAWRSGLPASCGIVLFRLPALGPARVGKVIADVLTSRDDWSGHFSVVEPGRIRVRVLPPGP
jgi:predicted nuclease of predicted toxin-antitoxin system